MIEIVLVLLFDLLPFHKFIVLLHLLPLLHLVGLLGDVLVVPAIGFLLLIAHIGFTVDLVVQLLLEMSLLVHLECFLHLLQPFEFEGLILVDQCPLLFLRDR